LPFFSASSHNLSEYPNLFLLINLKQYCNNSFSDFFNVGSDNNLNLKSPPTFSGFSYKFLKIFTLLPDKLNPYSYLTFATSSCNLATGSRNESLTF